MAELKDVIETLDNAADSFENIANKEQKKIYGEVITLAKDLDLDASGKVKQSIANLKRLTQIKAKLAALSKDKEWVAGISGFATYFGILQKQQNEYFSSHFPEHALSATAKEKNNLMRQMAVQNTMDALMGDGLKANVTDKLNDILLRAVTTGARFSDLQEELHAHLLGKDGGQGAFARYATTYATTALSQYTGQTNKLLSEGLNTDWFMYTGSNKETTREFCEQLTKKKYIHRSEIATILTGRIDEYQCAIYPKTGLPYGMIEGTTVENFQCNCGGWNCRHQLVPVADAVVPATLRAKFAKKDDNPPITEQGTKEQEITIPGYSDEQVLEVTRYLEHENNMWTRRTLDRIEKSKGREDYQKMIKKAVSEISHWEELKKAEEHNNIRKRIMTSNTSDYIVTSKIKEHNFKDGISHIDENGKIVPYNYEKECVEITTKSGIKMYIPTDLDAELQHLSFVQIEEAMSMMPDALKGCIDYIQFTDIRNPMDDKYWKKAYFGNKKEFKSFATDGRKMTFFANSEEFDIANSRGLYPIFATFHEAAHSFDNEHRITSRGIWKTAREKDAQYEGVLWISAYADDVQNDEEDFAESVALLYEKGSAIFRMKYPNRYAILENYKLTP